MISAIDYARFITTIDGRPDQPDLISSNLLKTMLTVTPQSRTAGEPYGMGWQVDEGTAEILHTGFGVTIATIASRHNDGSTYVVF